MSTKLTDVGDEVRIETVASFGGKPPRTFGAVLVPKADVAAIRLAIIQQAEAIRRRKGISIPQEVPVV